MSASNIVIDQSGLSAGLAARSRDDVVEAVLVQLSNDNDAGVRSWRWSILAQPAASVATLSNPSIPNPTFTPDVVGTYRIQLLVDEANEGQRDIRTVILRDANSLRIPAAGESDESNYALASGVANIEGFAPDLEALLELVRTTIGTGSAGGWAERYLGNLAAAPVVDLATGTNPTVAVANLISGQVASATWTSNAGDATGTTAQGTVSSFGTDGSTGLVFEGASATANFTNTAHNAPHIFALWSDVLGEDPRPGVEYCVMVRILSQDIGTAAQAAGVGCYTENDATAPVDIASSPIAKVDEKRLVSWIEHNTAVVNAIIREDSSDFTRIFDTRLPAGFDVVALIFRSGVMVTGAVGVYDVANDVFPEPDEMTVVDTWLGLQLGFTAQSYLDREDRIAVVCQSQVGSTFDATFSHIRVLSKD